MAGLIGGRTQSNAPTRLNGIQVQSSVAGSAIPMGWGTFRVSANLLWYGGFKSTAIKQKAGGKGGGSQVTGYNYSASVVMGVCAGPIDTIRTVYKDQTALNGVSAAGLTLVKGDLSQAPWSYLSTSFPAQAIGYSGIAYVAASNYALSTSATLPNHSFEVQMGGRVTDDANPKDIVWNFLGAVPYWQTSWQADYTAYGNYCLAAGLLLSPVIDSQRAAQDFLTEILLASNSDCVWSEGLLKIVPYADAPVAGNGVTFTPDLTPIYALDDSCFIPEEDGGEPVLVSINKDDDAWNYIQVEYLDRAQQYNTQVVPGTDPASIDQWGKRINSSPYSLHSICDRDVAARLAQILVQRTANVRRTFQFSLPWNYCLLDPMDLVSITSGDLDDVLVRITEISEASDGLLDITAEEMLVGTASPPLISRQTPAGYVGNYEADPGNVVAPVMVNPPLQLTGGEYELWIGVAGGANWGGCEVWVSYDDTTYLPVGVIDAPARYGVTTSQLAAGSDPDTLHSVDVDLSVSNGSLAGATPTAASNHVTLALLGTEVIAYSAATLTGANRYTLGTYMRRGLMGTTIATQNAGSTFLRLDSSVFAFGYRKDQVGKTVWIKFRSFNSFNQAYQDISTCAPYQVPLTPSTASFTILNWADVGDTDPNRPRPADGATVNPPGQSLQANDSFETFFNGAFPGWTITGNATQVAAATQRRGTKACRMTGYSRVQSSARIPVTAGETLYASVGMQTITDDTAGGLPGSGHWSFYYLDQSANVARVIAMNQRPFTAADGPQTVVNNGFVVPAGVTGVYLLAVFEENDAASNAVGELDWFTISRTQDGSTVGATVGSNIYAPGTTTALPATDLQNSQIGINSGKLTNVGSSATGVIVDNQLVVVKAADGTISTDGGVTSGGVVVDNLRASYTSRAGAAAAIVYEFASGVSPMGALSVCTLSASGGILTVTATGADPNFGTTGLSISGSAYPKVRARFRSKTMNAPWEGDIFYQTGSHSWSGSFYKNIPQPPGWASGDWCVAEWDMSALTVGGSDWTASLISGLRFDFPGTQTNLDVDWIALGDFAHGAPVPNVQDGSTKGGIVGANIFDTNGSTILSASNLKNDQIGGAGGRLTNVGAAAAAMTVDNSLASMTAAGVFSNGAGGGAYSITALDFTNVAGGTKPAANATNDFPVTTINASGVTVGSGSVSFSGTLSGNFDQGIISRNAIRGGAYCEGRFATATYGGFGFCTTTMGSYNNGGGWVCAPGGPVLCFDESGATLTPSGSTAFSATSVYGFLYDGAVNHWFKDGVEVATRAAAAADRTYFFNARFNASGGSITGLKFQPAMVQPRSGSTLQNSSGTVLTDARIDNGNNVLSADGVFTNGGGGSYSITSLDFANTSGTTKPEGNATRNSNDRALNRNSAFQDGLVGWSNAGIANPPTVGTSGSSIRGGKVATFAAPGFARTEQMPVTPGETLWIAYRFATTANRSGGAAPIWYAGAEFAATIGAIQDLDGGPVSNAAITVAAGVQSGVAQVTVPAGRYAANVRIAFDYNQGATGAAGYVDYLEIHRDQPGSTLGAASGVNLTNSGGATLSDARVDNANNVMTPGGVFTNGAGATSSLTAVGLEGNFGVGIRNSLITVDGTTGSIGGIGAGSGAFVDNARQKWSDVQNDNLKRPADGATAGRNAIINSGAESGSVAPWKVDQSILPFGTTWTGTFGVDTISPVAGKYRFVVTKGSTGETAAVVYPAVPVKPGQIWSFRATVWGASSSASGFYLRLYEKASAPASGYVDWTESGGVGHFTSVTTENGPLAAAPTLVQYQYKVPVGVYFVSPSIIPWTGTPTCYFDEVEFFQAADFGLDVIGATKPADNATADLTLVVIASCTVRGNSASSTSGTDGGAIVRVAQRIKGPVLLGARVAAFGTYFGISNASDGAIAALTGNAWNSNSYNLNVGLDGVVRVFEGTTIVNSSTSVSVGDTVWLLQDETRVQYIKNGVVFYTSPSAPARNQSWAAVISLGAGITADGFVFSPAAINPRAGATLENSSGTVLSDARVDNGSNSMSAAGVFTNGAGGSYSIAYDNLPDGASYAKVKATELTSGIPSLAVAGSGKKVGDARNLPNVVTQNLGYKFTGAISYSAAAGSPATATISVTAGTLYNGSVAVPYNAMSVGVSGTGGTTVSYFLYVDDAANAGGSQTLGATTTGTSIYQSDSRILIGSCDVFFPLSGGGSGGGTGGGGSFCAWADSWVETRNRGFVRARDVVAGDLLRVLTDDRESTRWEACTGNAAGSEEGWRITSRSGVTATVSESTPITLRDGRIIAVAQVEEEELPVFVDQLDWETCSVSRVGPIEVAKILVNQKTYAAGDEPGRSILTHNPKP